MKTNTPFGIRCAKERAQTSARIASDRALAEEIRIALGAESVELIKPKNKAAVWFAGRVAGRYFPKLKQTLVYVDL